MKNSDASVAGDCKYVYRPDINKCWYFLKIVYKFLNNKSDFNNLISTYSKPDSKIVFAF